MNSIRIGCLALFVASTLSAVSVGAPDSLAVHEWGTFTSVAGPLGEPVDWQPLAGPGDLPCFVNRLSTRNLKGISASVRLETPVVYFYTPRPLAVSVRVRFPQGMITEWYPRASRVEPSSSMASFGMSMEWNADVQPGASLTSPVENRPSRYYAARATDAAPLRIGDQQEKLIFYRGVGNFAVPLKPVFTREGRLKIGSSGNVVPAAIVFENRGGRIGYRRIVPTAGDVVVDPPALTGQLDSLRAELEEILTAEGLYPKEARAMLETWRDSWFEEGTRVLYIAPRSLVDDVLPLTVNPSPAALARVFVGRVEVLSPPVRKEIEQALAADDSGPLEKYGRFQQPFLNELRRASDRWPGPRVRAFLNAAYSRALAQTDAAACGK